MKRFILVRSLAVGWLYFWSNPTGPQAARTLEAVGARTILSASVPASAPQTNRIVHGCCSYGWGKTVSGRVFLDANANGRLDIGEPGLAGVPLTDGIQFVHTRADGAYEIELAADPVRKDGGVPILSVRFPSGFWPSSPWYRRAEEFKPGQSVDFGLRQDQQSLPLTFVHGTDCHVPRGGADRFIGFRNDLQELKDSLTFCFLTGDLVDLSDGHPFDQAQSEYAFFAEQTRNFPVPLFCVPGNHDLAGVRARNGWDKESPAYGYGFFTRHVGPLRWSFDYADIHWAGVDFNRWVNGKWEWGVPDTAVRWLDRDLSLVKPGTRIFLFVHFPQDSNELAGVVGKYRVEQVFHGHDHRDRASTMGQVNCLSGGSLAEVFEDKDRLPGYRLVQVSEEGLDMFYRATQDPHAITLDFPRTDSAFGPDDAVRGAFYDPEAKITQLTLRIGDQEQSVPFVRGPVCCRFNARLKLERLAAGLQPITVSVTDGRRTWQFQRHYRLLASPPAKDPAGRK